VKKIFVVFLVVVLAGCSSTSTVPVKTIDGTYHIETSGLIDFNPHKTAINAANEHCASMSLEMVLVKSEMVDYAMFTDYLCKL